MMKSTLTNLNCLSYDSELTTSDYLHLGNTDNKKWKSSEFSSG